MSDKIVCQVCSGEVHAIQKHIEVHTDEGWTLERYKEEFPDAPLISDKVRDMLAAKKMAEVSTRADAGEVDERRPLHDVFNLGHAPAAMTPTGAPIPITVLGEHDYEEMVPDIDGNHVHDIDLIKIVLMGFEENMPIYLWGHSGTGKTTSFLQICAHTNRPVIRVQHTLNTEESHILGYTELKGGETRFNPGPLALAMRHGWVYLADEYDFGVPHVLSVYQPVLEGHPLVIKEAEDEWRVVKPHPRFRIVATGNTNGAGDETGLYQGTQLQNAANFERFGIVREVRYMQPEMEELILQSQAKLHPTDASTLVRFANRIREAVDRSEISMPISPRALINAGKLGTMRGDFIQGLELAYLNRLSGIDREAARQIAQRVLG